jgi:hypothetical protein
MNGLLQGVDDVLAGFKSDLAMSRRDDDNDAGFADFERPRRCTIPMRFTGQRLRALASISSIFLSAIGS